MKENHFNHKRYHTSGRRTLRLLVQLHSEGFVFADTEALSETLSDSESGRRFTRGATTHLLQQLCDRHVT
jgi:hypothetical protein